MCSFRAVSDLCVWRGRGDGKVVMEQSSCTQRDGRIVRGAMLTHMRVMCPQSVTNISFNQTCGQKQLGLLTNTLSYLLA